MNNNLTIKGLEEILQRGIDEGAFPGCTYCLIVNDKTYFGCLGNKELFPNIIPNNIDTIYDMASLTKVVCTTTCVMKLVEMGLVRMYDNVQRYLPRFKYDNITIFNLLTHTSGLPEGIPGPKDELTSEMVWDKIYEQNLIFNPLEHISYSDINYMLLGKIVEKVSGMPLNEFADKYIFAPLEMKDTGYLPKDKERCAATELRMDKSYEGYVKGQVHDETAWALGGVAGHAGLFSTVKDLEHFLKMILNKGVWNGKRILSDAIVNELFDVKVKEYKGVETHPLARCLGWQTKDPYSSSGELCSEETILHTGFTGTNIFIDRKNNVAWCLLTNRVHPKRGNVLHMHVRACAANYIMSHKEEF